MKSLENMTIDDFFSVECNLYTKQVLLKAIEKSKKTGIEREEFTFNIYNVILYYKRNEILITDDICPDENLSLIFPLDKFYSLLDKFNPLAPGRL